MKLFLVWVIYESTIEGVVIVGADDMGEAIITAAKELNKNELDYVKRIKLNNPDWVSKNLYARQIDLPYILEDIF